MHGTILKLKNNETELKLKQNPLNTRDQVLIHDGSTEGLGWGRFVKQVF